MKVVLKTVDPAGLKTPALIVFLFEEDKPDLKRRPDLADFQDLIGPRLKAGDFKAEHLSLLTLFPLGSAGPERLILVGLGPEKEFDPARLRQAAAKASGAVLDLKLDQAALLPPPPLEEFDQPDEVVEASVLGVRLGQYRYAGLKTKKEDQPVSLKTLNVILAEKKDRPKAKAAVDAALAAAEAVFLTRDLVNRPANMLHPRELAEEAEKIAASAGLKCRIMDAAEAEKKGMGAFLAVGRGSDHPGRVIILEYKGGKAGEAPTALVGKAITFDSGGLCLKSAEGMSTMKTDMAGGAVVLGVMAGAAALGLKTNLVGIVPAAENMPDGRACRPGDVLTSLSGQTIEVTNTDAEGRLILADALTLAGEYKPKRIVDLATLTGACVVALGEKCAGLMGTSPELIEELKQASAATGERVWELPLFEDYFELYKSETADFKNSGARYAGTITAALFLKRFVGDAPWAHLDIAGPARSEKGWPDAPAGGTGFGVHLLLNWLRRSA